MDHRRNCVMDGKVDLGQITGEFTLHAVTFLEHQAELLERGMVIESARDFQMAGVPTSKVRALFSGGYNGLRSTLGDIFGTNDVLGPKNLSGPYHGKYGTHYRLGEYAHAGGEVHGQEVHNTIIDIYAKEED